MHPYTLHLPTRLVFGEGAIEKLPELTKDFGKKVLIVMGGGSVKRNGILGRARELLRDRRIFELSGVEPNPRISTIRKGVEICKKEGIEWLLPIGAGSVIDSAKAIAAGAFYEGDAWGLVLDSSKIKKALPIFVVLTNAATGSEYDDSGVISNLETDEKLPIGSPLLAPVASIMDPAYTCTVPPKHTAAGAADIFSHTIEQYIVADGNILTDAMCEGMLKTVIECTPRVLKNPNDLDARGQLMMASSFGCCGLLTIGRTPTPWPCHAIEHEISAWHDITHGEGLAVITPHWMRWSLTEKTAPRLAQYGVRIFGLDPRAPAMENAEKAIEKTSGFFRSIGIPATLSELGVTDEHFEAMADHVLSHWWPLSGAFRPLDREGILAILRASL
ncbi:iron-containing alcohol dehydrogenase [Mesosutterella sp. AGMB02718]|uniref:Iron-containing alcohol dehydrogenase n=1 Tax=Mesosutterella faecium TaxID=2925194 RepID=A0ABT7IRU6_9BURK|nr:iron-containing alcohol dehydrogenase [Mesosutterella sp. AGMB02718]MDL2060002.1 iron-containing alcohol dehydrogenase [Mesosutterella sp. AGMB02718]